MDFGVLLRQGILQMVLLVLFVIGLRVYHTGREESLERLGIHVDRSQLHRKTRGYDDISVVIFMIAVLMPLLIDKGSREIALSLVEW